MSRIKRILRQSNSLLKQFFMERKPGLYISFQKTLTTPEQYSKRIRNLPYFKKILSMSGYTGTNLAPFSNAPGGFWDNYGGSPSNPQPNQLYVSPYQNPYTAFPVTQNGKSNCVSFVNNPPAEQKYSSSAINELDGTIYPVNIGDHIVFSCWLMTTASSHGDTNPLDGIMIGGAFYDSHYQGICETGSTSGQSDYYFADGHDTSVVVPWGTSTWTLITVDFIVPSTIAADGYQGGFYAGQQVVPAYFAPQITVLGTTYNLGINEAGTAYAWNPIFYLNPSGSSGGTSTTDTIGDSTASHNDLYGMLAFPVTASQSGPLSTVGVNVPAANGNLSVAIYSTLSGNVLSGLLGQSASAPMVAGWNDLAIPGSIPIVAGTTYYIAFQFSSPSAYWYQSSSGAGYYYYLTTYSNFPTSTGTLSPYPATANMRMTYVTTPITPTQTYIVNWAITPTSGNLPFTISFSGYLSRQSNTPDTGTIVNGETIQIQVLAPGSSTWENTGISETTGAGPSGNGYFSGTWKLAEPGIYPGAWQFMAYYAGNTTKYLFGCVKGGKTRDLSRVNALIL